MFTNHTNYNENNVKSRSEVHISLQTLLTDEKWYTSNFFLVLKYNSINVIVLLHKVCMTY